MDTILIENTLIYLPPGTTCIPFNWDECYLKDEKGEWVRNLDQEDVENYCDYNDLSMEDWLDYYTEVKDGKYVFNGRQTYPTYLLPRYEYREDDSNHGLPAYLSRIIYGSDSDSD